MTAPVDESEVFVKSVVQYVLELRAQGHFLPYQDYEIIAGWVEAASGEDELLLVLAEILPDFFSKVLVGGKPKSLSSVNKKVLKTLKTKAMLK
jgi:hypothetical protein